MPRSLAKLSVAAALVLLAVAGTARAQDTADDPLDRYQRDPLPATRLGDDTEGRHGPTEPQFEGLPDYEADPLPPVAEGEPESGEPRREATVGSAPPPGAFSPEPNAFGPPRGKFRLPPSIGAPGVAAPIGTSSVSEAARGVVSDEAASNRAAANVPPGANAAPVPGFAGDDDTQADPFEHGTEPTQEEWDGDRRDARSRELAMPDDYLDPAWPDDGSETRVAPEESDSVENVPLGDDEEMDQAEREDAERYKDALGLYDDPDEFKQDDWGDTPADRTRQHDVKEYADPAQW